LKRLLSFHFFSSFQAEKKVCISLKKGNVMAIFGPQDDYVAEHIKSITDMIEVPFIDTRYMVPFSVTDNISFLFNNMTLY
jgi:hypothetical protein